MSASRLLGRVLTGRVGQAVARRLPSTAVWERDWDICCVLDGCRVDALTDLAATHDTLPEPGRVESQWSVGSQSAEWLDRTFDPRHADALSRTAYVTGNPFSAQPADHVRVTSGDVLPLSEDDVGVLYEAWRHAWRDGDISTIPPGALTDAALAVWQHRDALDVDRVLVHYMQPHAPFRSRPEWFLGSADTDSWGTIDDGDEAATDALDDLSPAERAELEELAAAETDDVTDPWTRVRDGDLARAALWDAYLDNLEWVLDDLARLVAGTSARIAFTSDHGNALGEWGVWSHPPGTPVPAVRKVPWAVRTGTGERSRTVDLPDDIRDRGATDGDDGVDERLAALGYR